MKRVVFLILLFIGLVYFGSRVFVAKGEIGGQKIWDYETGGKVATSPAVSGGRVYVSGGNNIYCLDASTGQKIWGFGTGDEVHSSPAVSEGKVYVGSGFKPFTLGMGKSGDNRVYCLDANNGQKIWEFATGDAVTSSPAVSGGKVYVGSWDSKVYCLDANTGQKIWEFGTGDAVTSSPAVYGGKVYVMEGVLENGKIYCLDANNGQKIWEFAIDVGVYLSPAVSGGKVYLTTALLRDNKLEGKVYCLDANNGQKIWDFKIDNSGFFSPAISAGRVYVSSSPEGKVYCLDANNGQKIWEFGGFGIGGFLSPAVSGGRVYVVGGGDGGNGKIYCLDANNGQKIWEFRIGDVMMEILPAVSGGKVYVGSVDRKVYCLDAGGPTDPPWPMFRHDPQHTGDTSTPLEEVPITTTSTTTTTTTVPPSITTTTIPSGAPTVDLDSPKTNLRTGDSFILDLMLKSGGSKRPIDLFFSIEISGLFPTTIYLGPDLKFVPKRIPVVVNLTPIDFRARMFGPAPPNPEPSVLGEIPIISEVMGSFTFDAEAVYSSTKASVSKKSLSITVNVKP